jgi:hypothetical protein
MTIHKYTQSASPGVYRHRIVAKPQTQVNSGFVPYSPRAVSTG